MLALVVVAAVALAVPAFASRSRTAATSVTVTATEFHFKLSRTSAAHGRVTFTLVNKGKLGHDFKIGGKKTPVVGPGKSAKVTVTLKAGKFQYLCTVAGHAAAGMKGTFTAR